MDSNYISSMRSLHHYEFAAISAQAILAQVAHRSSIQVLCIRSPFRILRACFAARGGARGTGFPPSRPARDARTVADNSLALLDTYLPAAFQLPTQIPTASMYIFTRDVKSEVGGGHT